MSQKELPAFVYDLLSTESAEEWLTGNRKQTPDKISDPVFVSYKPLTAPIHMHTTSGVYADLG